MTTVDILSPAYVGEDRITIELNKATQNPRVRDALVIDIDYTATMPEGTTPPIEIVYKSAVDPDAYGRVVYRSRLPTSFSFSPLSAGNYLIRLRELGHNRWQGRLEIDVSGDEFSQVSVSERT